MRRNNNPSLAYVSDLVDDEPFAAPYSPAPQQAPVPQAAKPAAAPKKEDPDLAPMFSLDKIDFEQSQKILQIVSSNEIIIISLENSHIIRLDLKNPKELDDIEISRSDSIHRVFIDPTGNHVLIGMEKDETFYLHSSYKKPKPLTRLKGIVLTAVAWDKQNTSGTSTGTILIGTRTGQLLELSLNADQRERDLKPVYHIAEDKPITGLRLERFPGTENAVATSAPPSAAFSSAAFTSPAAPVSSTATALGAGAITSPPPASSFSGPKFFVMATTSNRLYQFVGGPTLEAMFSEYQSNTGFTELPGEISNSELHFYCGQRSAALARSFAWLTPVGIYQGALIFGSQNAGDSVMTDVSLIPYPKDLGYPTSMIMTEFHYLLLFPTRVIAVSKLSEQIVYEEQFPVTNPRVGKLRGLTQDPLSNSIWLYSERGVWQVVVTDESRKVWELYCARSLFDQALAHCKTPAQREIVHLKMAEKYFNGESYVLAADFYAKTKRSFEEICLKFFAIQPRDALKKYLESKLESIPRTSVTQQTCLVMWLVEVYLQKLNTLTEGTKEYLTYQKDLQAFLIDHKDKLEKAITYNLLLSHGRIDELLFYALLIDDHERVIAHHIQQKDYLQALAVMAKQQSEEVYYKFSPVLMYQAPAQTVDVLIRAGDMLIPRKLIPSLMRYSRDRNTPPDRNTHHGIRYLQFCVSKLDSTDPAVHNYLLSLYAIEDTDQKALLEFLSRENFYFDLKYALRLCTRHNKTRACVLIYSRMELFEEAVELALRVDLELAKEMANTPSPETRPLDYEELRRKLWLRIARHVVEEDKDIRKAMDFLKQVDLLKIEDILPFFPDFELIDGFKDAICSSLESYNREIETQKQDMNDSTQSANQIRTDITEIRNRYGAVAPKDRCELCNFPVLNRPFYLFPCSHAFHTDCMLNEAMRSRDTAKQSKIQQLQSRIFAEAAKPKLQLPGNTGEEINVVVPEIDKLRNELDDIVAAECVYCGQKMIESIAQPFVVDETWKIS